MESECSIGNGIQAGQRPIYLSFAIAGKVLALPVQDIQEITGHDQLLPVPGTPGRIRGKVTDLHGNTVPVMDLACRLGSKPAAKGQRTCIVVVSAGLTEGIARFGLIVDAVGNLLEILPGQMETCPSSGDFDGLIRWIAKTTDGNVLVLDAGQVLSPGEMAALCQAAP